MIDFHEEEDFSRTVFIINDDDEIEEMELGDLCQLYAEQTTTPKGVSPKGHLREMTRWQYNGEWYNSEEEANEVREQDIDDGFDGGTIKAAVRHELWTWGYMGNNREFIEGFDTEQEANHALLLYFKWDLYNGDTNPIVFDTREEAEAALNESSE